MNWYDVCVVGGGIVGVATALEVLKEDSARRVLLIEKEPTVAAHQTGHNSGVIHAGIYYKPGSLKARLCRAGAVATKRFCSKYGIASRTPGKLIVATDERELALMEDLEINARGNGIETEQISAEKLRTIEPNVAGVGALRVPSTGIVDYAVMTTTMARLFREYGGDILLRTRVDRIDENGSGARVYSGNNTLSARKVIVCAGLQTDRIARQSGIKINFIVVPFRGEYYVLSPGNENIVNHLIYPVPNPSLPFLGIHLTPMIDGSVTVGPNAVLSMCRENYSRLSFNLKDVASYISYPGFWKVMGKHLASGLSEIKDSVSVASYLQKCQKYCPSLRRDDLGAYRAGIRAQAVSKSGELIQDFHFVSTEHVLYVANAPSPAATSAIPIAKEIVAKLKKGAKSKE